MFRNKALRIELGMVVEMIPYKLHSTLCQHILVEETLLICVTRKLRSVGEKQKYMDKRHMDRRTDGLELIGIRKIDYF